MSENKNYDSIDDIIASVLGGNDSDPENQKSTDVSADNDIGEETISIPDNTPTSVYKVSDFNKALKAEQEEPEDQPKKKKRKRKNYSAYIGFILANFVVCVSVLLSLGIIVMGRDFLGIESNDNEFTIYIPAGSTTADIAEQLYNEGVIQYKQAFLALSKLKNADGNMYPGNLDVAYNMSYSDIIDSLMEMREARKTATVTFPEGITLIEAAKLLEANDVCDANEFIYSFNSIVYGYDFEKYVSSSSLKLYKYEGYLFPDTYEFYVGDTVYNVIKKIKSKTNSILSSEVIEHAAERGMTIDQVVILASIVEKEAGNVEDMKNIASVFINRLNNPNDYPRLQSDTSYSYINNVIKSVLTVEYQEMYDAYDTYTCVGLPVGAISNPGKDAIDAVLNPANTDYYYFCSNVDTREAYYATTYEEHQDNLKKAGLR